MQSFSRKTACACGKCEQEIGFIFSEPEETGRKNATLQQENVKLRTELSKQERLNNTKRGSKRKRTESKLEVPVDLRKLVRRCGAFELIRESLSSRQKQLAPEVLYVEYMSSEESAYEDEEDPITGEVTQKLKCYLTKKLSWERRALTNLKSKLDRAH
ncbi:unnamed protein product [Porites lobata]|uniref:Uncharacterized protein n=1 Tax=Porites lobata TaxID=104759 RepID=A0ABN8S177_9CNID|nr:unnamed protein product [Porites lobata]